MGCIKFAARSGQNVDVKSGTSCKKSAVLLQVETLSTTYWGWPVSWQNFCLYRIYPHFPVAVQIPRPSSRMASFTIVFIVNLFSSWTCRIYIAESSVCWRRLLSDRNRNMHEIVATGRYNWPSMNQSNKIMLSLYTYT